MPNSLKLGLDVVRTDRSLLYYESSDNQARLWDVLAVYSWIDRDIGYCQGGNLHSLEKNFSGIVINFFLRAVFLITSLLTGMSDLCSPIIVLIENEADAFWCFERLMRRVVCIFML